ncbi:glucose 1-dehydrogenase [Variovorax rhizosphaerae]|uniref:Glucose 1-dehydrogenase n=1 Tax=Variovorax rhizosphaerae TaxID=1836200 RepID=A0ABU8WV62_9BURK
MDPTRMLEDKIVLITGAAAGIGRATALLAAREGARLALADIDLQRAEETADLVVQAGGQALALRVDISNASAVGAMVEDTVSHYGRLDHAFNNAGIAQWQCGAAGRKVGELTEEQFAQIMGVNVTGTWLCMRAEIAHMLEQGGGTILNTASVVGSVGRLGSGAYAASKHAIIGLSKSAAIEYADAAIRVNCLCPGFIDTGFLKASRALRGDQLLASVPMRRLGQPEEMAEMAVWLMSDRARYATGSLMTVDGGFMAG